MNNPNIILPIRIVFDLRAARMQGLELDRKALLRLRLNNHLREKYPELTDDCVSILRMNETVRSFVDVTAVVILTYDQYITRNILYQCIRSLALIDACHDAAIGPQELVAAANQKGFRFDDIC